MANDQAMQENFEALLQSIVGPKFYNDAKEFAVKRPFIFAAILSISILSLVPMIIFIAFAVTTLFIALICFLCIEGSIIAIGGIIFIGVVSFISVIVAFIMAGVAAAYFALNQIRRLLKSSPFPCMSHAAAANGEATKADVTVSEVPDKKVSSNCDTNSNLDNINNKPLADNFIRQWLDGVTADSYTHPEMDTGQHDQNAEEDVDNANSVTSGDLDLKTYPSNDPVSTDSSLSESFEITDNSYGC